MSAAVAPSPGPPPIAPPMLLDDEDDPPGLVGVLSRALERQTDTIAAGLADLKAEARSTRLWMVGLVALAIVSVVGVVGVSITLEAPGVGSVTTAPPTHTAAADGAP